MAKLKVGDLVCIPRRKNKGLGIVLKHVEDITKEIDTFKGICWKHIFNITTLGAPKTKRASSI